MSTYTAVQITANTMRRLADEQQLDYMSMMLLGAFARSWEAGRPIILSDLAVVAKLVGVSYGALRSRLDSVLVPLGYVQLQPTVQGAKAKLVVPGPAIHRLETFLAGLVNPKAFKSNEAKFVQEVLPGVKAWM